ncbi:MAG: T9SS type A sorting domain-containing protein [Bacteroidia bacterium]|nr:T9SS type A sorting domain-containing protein [Bacteroidia bacterium]
MKKNLLNLMMLAVASMLTSQAFSQMRYIDKMFASVQKTTNVEYDSNISVNLLYGQTLPGPFAALTTSPLYTAKLLCDIYQPTGDVATARPLIILLHTGSYLPTILNQQTTGSKNDSATVEMANQFALRGYVVAAINYRLGWNPQTLVQEQATQQLLQATYRGLQDARNAVRFFRMNASTYKIDTSKIIVGGQGTGGYISLGLGSVSTIADIETNPKFLLTDRITPMVPTAAFGNWLGIGGSPTLNIQNNASVSSNVHMTFNFGGAMGDTTWMKPTSLPVVSLQTTKDPFAPYNVGNVIVPTTGTIVIPNAAGASKVIRIANQMGINAKLNSMLYVDPVSARALMVNPGVNNIFGFESSFPFESAPWEFWDRPSVRAITAINYRGFPFLPANGRNADSLSMLTNPFMAQARGTAYCDTIARYIAPRIAVQMDLTGNVMLNAFSIISPTPGANINIRDTAGPVVISWGAAKVTGAQPGSTTYYVSLDTITGNFNTPLYGPVAVVDTTALVLTQKFLFDHFSNVAVGQSIFLKLRISVKNGYYGKNSNTDHPVILSKKGTTTSLGDVDFSSSLTVYPNPATANIKVSMDPGKSAINQLIIMDITGREVGRMDDLNTHSQNISLSGLGSGIYFMNVKTVSGAFATKRFIVQ